MKKSCIIFFLLPAFFIPVFAYAGNTAFNTKQGCAVSPYTYVHAYTNIGQDHEPAISTTNQFCVSAGFNLNTGIQRIINFHEFHYSGINYSLRLVIFPVGTRGFLPQKKYLFYIYPSHDFW